jgi:hypothetical protein
MELSYKFQEFEERNNDQRTLFLHAHLIMSDVRARKMADDDNHRNCNS